MPQIQKTFKTLKSLKSYFPKYIDKLRTEAEKNGEDVEGMFPCDDDWNEDFLEVTYRRNGKKCDLRYMIDRQDFVFENSPAYDSESTIIEDFVFLKSEFTVDFYDFDITITQKG